MRWKQGRRGRLSSRHTDALSLYTCVLTGPQQLSCVTHGSPCLPCCLVPFSNPFPAQDVFTEAFLNPSEVLGSHCQGGKTGCDRYVFIDRLVWPATLCPLIPKPSIATFFFSLWLFYLPGKLSATGLFRLALETVSEASP